MLLDPSEVLHVWPRRTSLVRIFECFFILTVVSVERRSNENVVVQLADRARPKLNAVAELPADEEADGVEEQTQEQREATLPRH